MTELHFLSASTQVKMLRRREISCRQLLDHYLARTERYHNSVNAIVTLDVEGARARATQADAALARGDHWGPLHGLPITVKDSLETEGMRTTSGAPILADHLPAKDADAVARLRAAGAVIFGKTNLPILAGDLQSYNELFGTTNNPWDLARTPGGSSGGAAAALAAGLTALELGSDIGGSIRTPCSWTGLFGHKPTLNIVPTRGHIPGPPGTLAKSDLAVLGPLARSADDLDLALDVLAGPPDDEAVAWKLTLPGPRHTRLKDYRVAVFLEDRDFPLDTEVHRVLREAVDKLRAAGAQIDERARPFARLTEISDPYFRLLYAAFSPGLPEEVFQTLLGVAKENPNDVMAAGSTLRCREWALLNEARAQLRAQFAAFFKDYDVLLMPTHPVPAIPHDHSTPLHARTMLINGKRYPYWDSVAWIAPATLSSCPASQAPVGRTHAGLPVGIQIVGPYLEDRTTIDFARHIETVCGGFVPPPGF